MNSRWMTALASIVLTGFCSLAHAATKGPDAGHYTGTDQTVFSYVDISGTGGGTAVLTGVDDGTTYLTLPFPFQFYGTTYNAVCVSSNGALYFTPDAPTCAGISDFANVDIAAANTPGDLPAILPFWTDLSFSIPGAGSVYYAGLGTAGNRRFVIQWSNAYSATSTSPVNFQVVLNEGTNVITFQYQNVALGGGDPASDGGTATIGIHNSGGQAGNQQLEWSYDAPVLTDGLALFFQTNGLPGTFALTSPADGATGVGVPVTLSWSGASGAASYDVFFGTTNPPALATNTTSLSYAPPSVAAGTKYYWQVVAKNASGSTPSAVASFTTASGGSGSPPPPPPPTPAVITWPTPSPITYGTPLSATQLNASANVAGIFSYNPPAGTILNAGMQTLSVTFTPSAPSAGSASASVVLNVMQAAQTITFAAIPDHTTDDTLFNVSATASSGLPIVFSIVSGPATILASTVNITGPGTVVVQADQPGNANIAAAPPVQRSFQVNLGSVKIASILNAASYAKLPLAADGYSVIFGTGLGTQPAVAGPPPLSTTLGGTTVTITDSAGTTLPALLYYVSFTQINFVAPEGLAKGAATVTIANSAGKSSSFPATIAALSPALFTSDASGKGAAAAYYIVVPADGGPFQYIPSSACSGTPVSCSPVPIDLGSAGTKVYLSLYGTGLRGVSGLAGVSAMAGNVPLTVTYAGLQPTYPGLDQVNILLDRALIGTGQVTVQLTLDGIAANPVAIAVK